MSQGSADYDPEIKDIADYVCNKPIESRLAVSSSRPTLCYVLGEPRLTEALCSCAA